MTTEIETNPEILYERVNECVTEYLESRGIINYFDHGRYDFYWGKYKKTGWFTEMLLNRQYTKYGNVTIKYDKTESKIKCWSENELFTRICCGIEKHIQEKLKLTFDVVIVKNYVD